MQLKTARKVVSDSSGALAVGIAGSRGSSPQQIASEAKAMLKKAHKAERRRKA